MCGPLETPLYVLLCNCSFSSFRWIFFPTLHACHLFCSLHASVLLTVPSTRHPPRPHNCHTKEPRTNPMDKHARVSTRPCSCNQKCPNWNPRTVQIICTGSWWRTSGSLLHSNTLRIYKAALPISGTLLRAVEFWSGKTSSRIHWLSTITHPSTCHPDSAPRRHVYGTLRWHLRAEL